MKHSFPIKLTVFCIIFSITNTFAQNCNCDSLLFNRRLNWPKWVTNSDSIRIVDIIGKGPIKTKRKKEQILKLLVSDTAWVAILEFGGNVPVKLARLDTLAGRQIRVLDNSPFDSTKGKPFILPGDPGRMKTICFASQAEMIKYFNENIALTDEYFEVYFSVAGQIIMSPSICQKYYCTVMDNIMFNLFLKK
jgi:hypothetical protein